MIALAPVVAGLLVFCIGVETLQQLSFKTGADRASDAPRFARAILTEPLIWLGIVLWVVESVSWVLVLQRAPLSVAYPMMTMTYASVPVAGVMFLRERMSRRQALGSMLILGGVICVGLSGG